MGKSSYKKHRPQGYCCRRCDGGSLKKFVKSKHVKKYLRREGKKDAKMAEEVSSLVHDSGPQAQRDDEKIYREI